MSNKEEKMKRKKSICFIDNEKDEIRRFKKFLGDDFYIGAGKTVTDAIDNLKRPRFLFFKHKYPHLFVIDMYFKEVSAHEMTNEEKMRLHRVKVKFNQAKKHFFKVLGDIGESRKGGFDRVQDLRDELSKKPDYVFFTRKGTLEDAQQAFRLQDKPLKVLKKPDCRLINTA